MATLQKIVIQDFRNIQLQELAFSPNINCISGGNGEGKTNLLDAIWYLSMTKSAFSTSDRFNFRYGTSAFALSGTYAMPGGATARFSVRVQDGGQKTVRRDDKPYDRISAHIGVLPIVMVSPFDSALINDAGEERRKYLNFILSQIDRPYLQHIQAYNQLLMQRNKLLKAELAAPALLDTISERMAPHADYVHAARRNLCERLRPLIQGFYAQLAEGRETVDVAYRSDLDEDTLEGLFAREAEKDRVLRYTTTGIQRDDLLFRLDGHPLRRCGSQGQQKSFLLAMKMAQFRFVQESCGQTPILLLDDVFDKLDMQRVENLLKLVSALDFGQIFLTDSNKVRLESVSRGIDADVRSYHVEAGRITAE